MRLLALSLVLTTISLSAQSTPRVPVGTLAPGFTLSDDTAAVRTLDEFRGKFVVLEWHQKGCSYTTKHYRGSAMQKLQAEWIARGVVWLLLSSSAEGFNSFMTPAESRAYRAEMNIAPSAMLLDPSGKVGRLYGVTTALHMLVIDPKGNTIYNGAIDDQPKTEASSLSGAKNYVSAALQEALAGRPVTTATTEPYGCSIHYGPAQ